GSPRRQAPQRPLPTSVPHRPSPGERTRTCRACRRPRRARAWSRRRPTRWRAPRVAPGLRRDRAPGAGPDGGEDPDPGPAGPRPPPPRGTRPTAGARSGAGAARPGRAPATCPGRTWTNAPPPGQCRWRDRGPSASALGLGPRRLSVLHELETEPSLDAQVPPGDVVVER